MISDDPRKFDELTPEQQAALVELWQQIAGNMRKMSEAFLTVAAACVETVRIIETVKWEVPRDANAPDPGDSL